MAHPANGEMDATHDVAGSAPAHTLDAPRDRSGWPTRTTPSAASLTPCRRTTSDLPRPWWPRG